MMELENLRQQTAERIAEFFSGESMNPQVDTYKKLLDFEQALIQELSKNIDMAYEHGYYDGRFLGKQTPEGKFKYRNKML